MTLGTDITKNNKSSIKILPNKYSYFSKVGHIFLEKDYFKKIKDTGIRLFIFIDKKRFLGEELTYHELKNSGFGSESISNGFDILKEFKFIEDKGFDSGSYKFRMIQGAITQINTDYWNKKTGRKKPLCEESSHGQIPWILLDREFYKSGSSQLKNKTLVLYLFFTKFYNLNEERYIYEGSIRNIRGHLGYRNDVISNTIDFMINRKILTKLKKGIILNHEKFMKKNGQYFEKEDQLDEIFSNADPKPKKKINIQKGLKRGAFFNGLFFPYKNQKVTWQETEDKPKNSHIFDEYIETGFLLKEKRIPTLTEIKADITNIKRTLERNNWTPLYFRDLMRFTSKKMGAKGFRLGLIERLHREYQKELEDEKLLKISLEREEFIPSKNSIKLNGKNIDNVKSIKELEKKQVEKLIEMINRDMNDEIYIRPYIIEELKSKGGEKKEIEKILEYNKKNFETHSFQTTKK